MDGGNPTSNHSPSIGNVDSEISPVEVEQSKVESSLPPGKRTESDAEKSDSGMDEESFLQSQGSLADSDDEMVSHKRSRKKGKMIIDDDEEDDEPDTEEAQETAELSESLNKTDDSILSKSPGDTLEDETAAESATAVDSEGEQGDSEELHLEFKDKEVFDAESSDDELPGTSERPLSSQSHQGSDEEEAENGASNDEEQENSGDEGFDESQMDPELLKKLKKMKGAGKSSKQREKHSRKAKPTAEKMLEIFSESQRLLRDSRVNLPYYEPETKSLDDFLARAAKKKQEYAALRRPKDILKAQIIHEKLSITPPILQKPLRKYKRSPKNVDKNVPSDSCSPVSQDQTAVCIDSGMDSQELSQSNTLEVEPGSEPLLSQNETHGESGSGEDDLPDLVISSSGKPVTSEPSSESAKSLELTEAEEQTNTVDISLCNSETNEQTNSEDISSCSKSIPVHPEDSESTANTNSDIPDTPCESSEDVLSSVPSLRKDPSRDLFKSQSTASEVCATQSAENAEDLNDSTLSENKDNTDLELSMEEESGSSQKPKLPITGDSSTLDSAYTPTEPIENSSRPRKRLFNKLQGLDTSESPCLKGMPDDVICLDEPATPSTPKNPGLQKLLDRLAQHSKKRLPKPARDVDISIVEKEGEAGEKKELKLKSFTYHVQEEESVLEASAPGAKLSLLKQQLGQGMRKKRAEALQKRQQMYALENEEGFEKGREENDDDDILNEEEEEAEMTDGSDTDDDDEDEFELQFGRINDDSDDGKDYNPLVDAEAKDDEDDEMEYNSDFDEDSNDVHLHFDVSDEEGDDNGSDDEADKDGSEDEKEDSDNDDFGLASLKKKKTKPVIASDDEDETEDKSDEVEAITNNLSKQKKLSTSLDLWSNELTPMTKHLQDTQTQERIKYRSESQSPDLYSMADENESTSGRSFDHMNDSSQSIGSYNPHSQLLDADGYLRVAQTQKPRSRIAQLAQNSGGDSFGLDGFGSSLKMSAGALFKASGNQAGDEEITPTLIFQKSGSQADDDITPTAIFRGASSQVDNEEITPTAIFRGASSQADNEEITATAIFRGPTSQAEPDDNMRELMGFCFGTFGQDSMSEDAFPVSQNRKNRSLSEESKGKETDKDTADPFDILSDVEEDATVQNWKKRVLSDSEDENGDKDNEEDASDTEEVVKQPKFTGFKDKKKGIRKAFVEDEAELSGSEYDSDENVDLAEEDDILEEEAGDRDMAGVSEEALRNQVGKVHMKQIQDDDDREVMRFKEMYLQDGDLYSEGGGRMRNFRWKDMDDASQQDMFGEDSEPEQAEEEIDEAQWRKDRMEREKFLEESQNKDDEESSSLLNMGQFALKKDRSLPLVEQNPTPKPVLPPAQSKPKLSKKGSFLTRSKDALVKIAQVAKGAFGGTSSGKAKGFVFQSVGSSETQDENETKVPQQPPKRKAREGPKDQVQAAKKQKTTSESPGKPQVKRQNSIFSLLGKD